MDIMGKNKSIKFWSFAWIVIIKMKNELLECFVFSIMSKEEYSMEFWHNSLTFSTACIKTCYFPSDVNFIDNHIICLNRIFHLHLLTRALFPLFELSNCFRSSKSNAIYHIFEIAHYLFGLSSFNKIGAHSVDDTTCIVDMSTNRNYNAG